MPTNDSGASADGSGAKGSTADSPLSANPAKAAAATTAGSASTQAKITGDQSSAPGGKQVADVIQRAPSTEQPLGIPMASPARSAFDQLRDEQPDHPLVSATPAGEEPRGDQALPAFMTPSGSLPITQTAGSHAQALARVTSSPTSTPQDVTADTLKSHHILPEDFVRSMGRADLMAVAHDRGYDMATAMGGRRSLASKFLAEQAKDQSLTDPDDETDDLEDSDDSVNTGDTAPTTTTGAGPGGTSKDQASGKPQ